MRASAALAISLALIVFPQERKSGHRVEHSVVDGILLVRTLGAPKYSGPLFEIKSDLVLGIDDGEPEWQIFSGITGFLVAPDGRMILCDRRRFEVFIVSPSGELLSRLGRQGAGPGEFRELWYPYWAKEGEEFWIEDRQLNRMSRFSTDGEYLGTVNYAVLGSTPWRYLESLGDFRFLGSDRLMQLGDEDRTMKYWFLDSEMKVVSEFLELPSRVNFWTSSSRVSQIPFTRLDEVTTFPDGRLLSFHPGEGRLTIYSTSGEPLIHIERDWERKRITAKEKEEVRESLGESSSASLRRLATTLPFPQRYPAFSRAHTDDKGWIWVERPIGPSGSETADKYTFDIFGSDGVWIGVQELDFRPSSRYSDWIKGGYIYRTYLSESGAPRFERLRLIPIIPDTAGGHSYRTGLNQ